MFPRTILILALALSGALAQDTTWVEIDGQVFGARPDARGPIGGGDGYLEVVTTGDFSVRDTDALLAALAQAEAGQTVFIPGDVTLDLTARIYISELVLQIPAGVTLASDRGHNGSPGALLVSDALETPVMLEALGEDVRISGLRLVGPNPKRHLEHHRRSFGQAGEGRDYYYKLPVSDAIETQHARLEVDNCEISGFSHAGVFLQRGNDHSIHHNSIHHCQYNGLGYGVCLDVATAEISHNLFDFNRHSIAATGRPGCSYSAHDNVELGTSLSHCFDMHGGRDRKDGTDIAGSLIEIRNNTFRAPQTPIKIRGVPEERCLVEGNWFVRHTTAGAAVRSGARTEVGANAYGARP